ncbi:hypothetical protein ACFE04_020060 [Oxalis oulophora]
MPVFLAKKVNLSPTAPVPSIMGRGAVGPETGNFLEAIERLGAALLNSWNDFGCMNLLRDPYIHLSVLRADQHSAQLLLEVSDLLLTFDYFSLLVHYNLKNGIRNSGLMYDFS